MAYADRWLLPDGVEEILPGEAQYIEGLRRHLLDLFARWGYDLVIPPLVEYTESLLIGLGSDLDLLTFKMTDQLSGRALGVRADFTSQIARMDAHSVRREGVNRLCYAGHVLHTKARSALATRSPIQLGVELYGEGGLQADSEVISLLLESLRVLGLDDATVEMGHVAIYQSLVAAAKLNAEQQTTLFDLLQRKAATEIAEWTQSHVSDADLADLIRALPKLCGGVDTVIAHAQRLFAKAPIEIGNALQDLEQLARTIAQRYPSAKLYFDLSELPSFTYHTGVVFAAFVPGLGRAIASGGRYDHVGEVFGRARPATGFSVLDLTALLKLPKVRLNREVAQAPGIFVIETNDPNQWEAVQKLRQQGERVVVGFSSSEKNAQELNCDRQLELRDGDYQVVSLK